MTFTYKCGGTLRETRGLLLDFRLEGLDRACVHVLTTFQDAF